jgi:sterol 3beta-glucosyltransferase
MRITIIALGSRGDVQPWIALGKGLVKEGHAVRLATHLAMASLVTAYGIEFSALDDEPAGFFETPGGQRLYEAHGNAFRFASRLARYLAPSVDTYMQRSLDACADADVIVASHVSLLIGYSVAEKLDRPLIVTFLFPTFLSTTAFPEVTSFTLPQRPRFLGQALNQLSHVAARRVFWRLFTPAVNQARQRVAHLPPLPGKPVVLNALPDHADLILLCYSSLLLPRPPEWDETVQITGFCTLNPPENWQPDPQMVDFLQAGPAPIYIGFGSMSSGRFEETFQMTVAALTELKQRGIILVSSEYMSDHRFSEQIYVTTGVPHEWLFPQMSAIVHHGAPGTTAVSLAAGKPTLVIPHNPDQYFWGARIAALGIGPKPLLRARLSARKLAARLAQTLEDQAMRQKAAALGEKLRQENGVAQAISSLKQKLLLLFLHPLL